MTQIRVDEPRRQFNSRMHSAGHLIGHFVQALGWMPIKAHHCPGEGRVQFNPLESAKEVDAEILQQGIEQWVAHDLPRLTSMREGAREIGFGELPAYGCGGTHVRSLKDLGTVTIASLSLKKGTLSVHYSVD
jgi:Ser-tRNA(Ala) deacylase AlaX